MIPILDGFLKFMKVLVICQKKVSLLLIDFTIILCSDLINIHLSQLSNKSKFRITKFIELEFNYKTDFNNKIEINTNFFIFLS
ncbi:hypothetical protein BpHYR1_013096 [Brachionus plicatilis]|uniref:Uncharacterized protein n=1 Tax=Brachionus plicatilis TaxID=10195 RepID=A0A3M7P8Z5_BRAPC|nr:hypothetical protein BpHYR1_013096 [Brachionus plicatilis]